MGVLVPLHRVYYSLLTSMVCKYIYLYGCICFLILVFYVHVLISANLSIYTSTYVVHKDVSVGVLHTWSSLHLEFLPISALSSHRGYKVGSLRGQRWPDWDQCGVLVYWHRRALSSAGKTGWEEKHNHFYYTRHVSVYWSDWHTENSSLFFFLSLLCPRVVACFCQKWPGWIM